MAQEGQPVNERFPRSSAYHPDWVLAAVSGGANSLWLTEWLVEAMDLHSGMRVLDLGCGRGASSIFLHRELGVQVWATDLWFGADERLARIRDAGVEHSVFPIHADARALPFAAGFFDAIVSIDSFVNGQFVVPAGGQVKVPGPGSFSWC
ncbi:SAM-dependent methyltransferase [Pseudonocardia dioxanivorans]|uniref:SAM-dependent methyltransferase n=1 Tax=Pseudonocardia dioxanivorans TaxID=240495 RepID=UPI000304C6A5|nr:methyltransferase domain-containing protein [Pseudonocardia dioxanivorans]